MHVSLALILLVLAFALFAVDAWLSKSLIAAGLACATLSVLLGAVPL